MVSDRPQSSDSATVIMFRPRPRGKGRPSNVVPRWAVRGDGSSLSHIRPDRPSDEADEYRHRMTVHVLGLTFCIALAAAGVWLVNEIVDLKQFQDCVFSGRTDCLPLKMLIRNG
jgi:hypothetical protein